MAVFDEGSKQSRETQGCEETRTEEGSVSSCVEEERSFRVMSCGYSNFNSNPLSSSKLFKRFVVFVDSLGVVCFHPHCSPHVMTSL